VATAEEWLREHNSPSLLRGKDGELTARDLHEAALRGDAMAILFRHVRYYMEESMLNIFKDKVAFLQSALPDADAAILGASALVW
jgi:hypothetical protein